MQGQSNKGKFGSKHTKAKGVLMYKDELLIKEFGSLTEAANELDTYVTNIHRACNNQSKLIKGFSFKYKATIKKE